MALGNAWHFPGNPEPFGNAGMRNPVFPTDPVSTVTVFSGNQLCVPKTCATWADAPQLAVGLVSRLAPAAGVGRAGLR